MLGSDPINGYRSYGGISNQDGLYNQDTTCIKKMTPEVRALHLSEHFPQALKGGLLYGLA